MPTEIGELDLISANNTGATFAINNLLEQFEVYSFATVTDETLTAPPGSPTTGSVYIVASPATGDWAGQENNLAFRYETGWLFFTPSVGLLLNIFDGVDDRVAQWNGTTWDIYV